MNLEQQQLDTVARSRSALERARAYQQGLAIHSRTLHKQIEAGEQAEVSAAIGAPAVEAVDVDALRSELLLVERQHQSALEACAHVEAEHARHLADLSAMLGRDREARAKLAAHQEVRQSAQDAADASASVLNCAKAHAVTVAAKLADAQLAEAEIDRQATARLHAALRNGCEPIPDAPGARGSLALENDFRTARLTVERLDVEHLERLEDLASADKDVAVAVDEVLRNEAEAVATELEATEIRAAMLRRRLITYTERAPCGHVEPAVIERPARQHPGGWLVRDPTPVHQLPKVVQTPAIARVIGLSGPAPDRTGATLANWQAESDAWASYAAALIGDAGAESAFPKEPPYVPNSLTAIALTSVTPVSSLPNLGSANLRSRDRSAA